MSDPLTRTRYRVAQHWRFRTDTPEVQDTLVIIAVEDHPVQGIVCEVVVRFESPIQMSPNGSQTDFEHWFTQAALDASVTELAAERGPFPRHRSSTGEFRISPEWWHNLSINGDTATVGDVARDTVKRLKQAGEEAARQPPYSPPPDETLGLWSLIAHDKADLFRERLERHPSIAHAPLPRDWSDGYCYSGDEYEECYPLMLAAQCSSVEVAKVLLEYGADVRKRNSRGETALHFSGKETSGGCGADEVARMLCERGADPNAENVSGKPPLTCYYSMTEVAEVLVEFGAKLNLNHALRLEKLDWVRRQLRDNPKVVEEAAYPKYVVDDVVSLMRSVASDRTGLRNYGNPSEELRVMEIERQVFEEHRDILEGVVARGADLQAGSALFYAVQNYDTSLAAWLLEHGVDPNRDLPRVANYMPDIARTPRMVDLLKRYGAIENPYPHEPD